MFSKIYWNWKN